MVGVVTVQRRDACESCIKPWLVRGSQREEIRQRRVTSSPSGRCKYTQDVWYHKPGAAVTESVDLVSFLLHFCPWFTAVVLVRRWEGPVSCWSLRNYKKIMVSERCIW